MRHPPTVRQEELRRVIDLQNQANVLAHDIASRIEAGADFECGALGVHNLGLSGPEEWSKSGVIWKEASFWGIDIMPVGKLEFYAALLNKHPDPHKYVLGVNPTTDARS